MRIENECVWNVWNEWLENVLFTLIEALWCEIVGIDMLYVVKPSECDHLAKHVAWYECDLMIMLDYELSCFGIGFEGVWTLTKFTLDIM